MLSRCGCAALVLAAASPAFADENDGVVERYSIARDVTSDGAFTPLIARAAGGGRAVAVGEVTYSGAGGGSSTTLALRGDITVWGPFRVTVSVSNVLAETADGRSAGRPGIGAAAQLLHERQHGLDGAAYLAYKPEGFTEPEGEIELILAAGKQLGPVRGTANLAYGQDPEAAERDGELALALHVEPVRNLFAGVVSRYRDALGSTKEAVKRDLIAGATATYLYRQIGVTVTAGVAALETQTSGSMAAGATGTLSVGAVF